MTSSIANVPTAMGSRYLQQLCKHWSHDLQVEHTPEQGSVIFPKDVRGANYDNDAVVTFHANDGVLEVRIDASSQEQLSDIQKVVSSHLDRFAFREAPLTFHWN